MALHAFSLYGTFSPLCIPDLPLLEANPSGFHSILPTPSFLQSRVPERPIFLLWAFQSASHKYRVVGNT